MIKDRRGGVIRFLCFLTVVAMTSSIVHAERLTVDMVLDSVEAHHPKLKEEFLKIAEAEGGITEALGTYDTQLRSKNYSYLSGFYTGSSTESSLDLPIDIANGSLSTFYRKGSGNLPVYEDEFQTLDGGEFGVKLSFSLLRDWVRDPRQLGVELASYDKKLAQFSQTATLIALERMAVETYWMWVTQAKKTRIYENLLKIALERQEQLDTRVKAGDLAEFEALDNKRTILTRRSKLVYEQAKLQQYATKVSLFNRDDEGQPLIPMLEDAPDELPMVASCPTEHSLVMQRALDTRQDIKMLDNELAQLGVSRSFQETRLLPDVVLSSSLSEDRGEGSSSREGTEAKVFLSLKLPLQQRKNKGKIQQIKSKTHQYLAKRQYLKESISADLRNLLVMIQQSNDRYALNKEELAMTRKIEAGEREKFKNGASNLLFLAIREFATAEAEVKLLEARQENIIFKAQLEAACGLRQRVQLLEQSVCAP